LEDLLFRWAGLGGEQTHAVGSWLSQPAYWCHLNSSFPHVWKKQRWHSVGGCADARSQFLVVAVRCWYCRVRAGGAMGTLQLRSAACTELPAWATRAAGSRDWHL